MKARQLFTKLFWMDTIERVIATAGETFLGVLAGGVVSAVDWHVGVVTITTSTMIAFLKAMVAAAKADTDTASFTVDTKALGE